MKNIFFPLAVMALAPGLSAQAQDTRTMSLGSAVPAASSQRTIVLNSDTQWVNVMQGEEVKFVVGAVAFSWKFDGQGARPFDLRQVAPEGALAKPVLVYVANAGGHPTR